MATETESTDPGGLDSARIVICGAGIAGIAAAWNLSVRHGASDILLVDERAPLALTSDKSTEAYRNWWPGPDDAMVRLMNRSIDMLEELADATGNGFLLNRRGYFYATADVTRIVDLQDSAENASSLGAGDLRIHTNMRSDYVPAPEHGYLDELGGADLLIGRDLVQEHFPFLAKDTVAVLHARRCGWFSGQSLGMHLLEEAKVAGVRFVSGKVVGVESSDGVVSGVRIQPTVGEEVTVATERFVNAAGPLAKEVGTLAGQDLPLFSELHRKIAFDDKAGAVPRSAGLVICEDPIPLPWDDETRAELATSDETRWLTEPLPAGVHMRPEGHAAESQSVLVLWAYHTEPVAETFPLPNDAEFGEIALRGIARLIPGLAPYADRIPRYYMDGGYYTKTIENRPLIGPSGLQGAYVIAGLSGYGLMAACAAGELLAAHMSGWSLPPYATAFMPNRYDDPAYVARLAEWGSTAQL